MARTSKQKSTDLDGLGLADVNGFETSLFPQGFRREERLTSRLISTLELVRPFSRRFFDSIELTGRRPTTATRNLGRYQAIGVLEPSLDGGKRRADAALSLKYGSKDPWRCAFEVKYLTEGRNSKASPAKLNESQVAWTYNAAYAKKFDQVITISAAQPEGSRNPSGFEPSPRQLERTGLAHLSWLKVRWLLHQTRVKDAKSLSPIEDRILKDFAEYLKNSKIEAFARAVSLGTRNFAAVRGYCRGRVEQDGATIAAALDDVAVKWIQLTESVAQRLSIDTGALVHANGKRPTTEKVIQGILKSRSLGVEFKTESKSDGVIKVEINLDSGRATTTYEVQIADLLPAKNPQSRTRWKAIAELLEGWHAYKGAVRVLDSDNCELLPRTRMQVAPAAVAALASQGSQPQRIQVLRSELAAPRGRLRGDTISKFVESKAMSLSPWGK